MIAFDKAKKLAQDKLSGSNLTLDENLVIEKPFGWFFGVSENYGCSGLIVDRDDGHVFQLGSGFTFQEYFDAYEAGFKYDFYDLIILSVQSMSQTAKLLSKLYMKYVVSEVENGTVWKIHQTYSREQIQSALKTLPCTFLNQNFHSHFETFQKIKRSRLL